MFGENFRPKEEIVANRWDGLNLPDIGPAIEGCSNGQVEWKVERRGIKIRFVISVSRQEVDYSSRKASIDIYGFDEESQGKERAMVFKAACNNDEPGRYYDYLRNSATDRNRHVYWQVYYRRVEKDYRHKRLGTLGIQLLEKMVRMMGEHDPQVKGEWIQMDTQLSSVARLIADHTWLEKSGLGEYVSHDKPDFNYLPHEKDEQDAFRLITGVSEQLDDVAGKNIPQVRFRKKLD